MGGRGGKEVYRPHSCRKRLACQAGAGVTPGAGLTCRPVGQRLTPGPNDLWAACRGGAGRLGGLGEQPDAGFLQGNRACLIRVTKMV